MRQRTFCILVGEGFSFLSFSLIVGVLESANRAAQSEVYLWSINSLKGGYVVSDSGIFLPTDETPSLDGTASLPDTGQSLALLMGSTMDAIAQRSIANRVRRTVAHGGRVVAAGAASDLLAREGLLAGRRCAVHWRDYAILAERYPTVRVTRHVFEIDGPFHTSPGEMAMFDLMIRVVESDCGMTIAEQVVLQSLPAKPRASWDRQPYPDVAQLEKQGSPLARIVELMEDNIDDPLPLGKLIKQVPLSRRQVERHFIAAFGMPPKRFYLQVRLERARELLHHSRASVVEIALATGFVSASHFSKTYRTAFGASPTETRRVAAVHGETPVAPTDLTPPSLQSVA